MSDLAIKIENLSKQYRLGLVSTGTLSHDLNRWWHLVRGKEDPYLKVSETNDRAHKGESEYVWALKDINLEVREGEVLGIIGKNGAGKSTLLKILSKVTAPTTGAIKYKGRIGSLLEVGTGFHQELTGRENIFLNGAILGMTKAEVQSKLDEIVDFSGVERYIDTPVKRYSSGMMVRLGFAVAAYLEPDILVVDEVLAVGDAEFQKKAVGKMQEVSQEGGRTVLFVSHNMATIEALCRNTLVLRNGTMMDLGDTKDMIAEYLNTIREATDIELVYRKDRTGIGNIRFKKMVFENGIGPRCFAVGEDIYIKVTAANMYKEIRKARFSISINTSKQLNLISCDSDLLGQTFEIPPVDEFAIICKIINPPLNIGNYLVNVALYTNDIPEDWIVSAGSFSIETGLFDDRERTNHMPVLSKFKWELQS